MELNGGCSTFIFDTGGYYAIVFFQEMLQESEPIRARSKKEMVWWRGCVMRHKTTEIDGWSLLKTQSTVFGGICWWSKLKLVFQQYLVNAWALKTEAKLQRRLW